MKPDKRLEGNGAYGTGGTAVSGAGAGRIPSQDAGVYDAPMLTWSRVVAIVVGCALGGMVLGGLFGLLVGYLIPDAFYLTRWNHDGTVTHSGNPVVLAGLIGATGGVFLGGALGVFAVAVHAWVSGRRAPPPPPLPAPPLPSPLPSPPPGERL